MNKWSPAHTAEIRPHLDQKLQAFLAQHRGCNGLDYDVERQGKRQTGGKQGLCSERLNGRDLKKEKRDVPFKRPNLSSKDYS